MRLVHLLHAFDIYTDVIIGFVEPLKVPRWNDGNVEVLEIKILAAFVVKRSDARIGAGEGQDTS